MISRHLNSKGYPVSAMWLWAGLVIYFERHVNPAYHSLACFDNAHFGQQGQIYGTGLRNWASLYAESDMQLFLKFTNNVIYRVTARYPDSDHALCNN